MEWKNPFEDLTEDRFWHFCDIARYVNEGGIPSGTGHWRTNATRVCL
jgi:hypothetical protein